MSFAVLEGGSYFHHECLHGERLRGRIRHGIYAPELTPAALEGHAALVVADRIHPAVLRAKRRVLMEYLGAGGTLVVLGENRAYQWAPQVAWEFRPTNFWSWLDPNHNPGLVVHAPEHPIFRHLPARDFVWHYHGLLAPPPGAMALAGISAAADPEGRGGAILYDHPNIGGTGGRLVITTLDPFYHHGSFFMPAASRFLTGLLGWLDAEFG